MKSKVILMLVVAVASCGGDATPSTTVGVEVDCEQPPTSNQVSDLVMSVDPNPASPREIVDLDVSRGDLGEDALVGVDAMWQCWDGSAWVTTHVVYRGIGDNPGQTIAVNDSFQIHVPSIGLALDEAYPVVIPQVEAGVYRIEDKIVLDDGEVGGFVLVEVIDG
jgi:hypothetical protein